MRIFLTLIILSAFCSCKNCNTCPLGAEKQKHRKIIKQSKKMEKQMNRQAKKQSKQ